MLCVLVIASAATGLVHRKTTWSSSRSHKAICHRGFRLGQNMLFAFISTNLLKAVGLGGNSLMKYVKWSKHYPPKRYLCSLCKGEVIGNHSVLRGNGTNLNHDSSITMSYETLIKKIAWTKWYLKIRVSSRHERYRKTLRKQSSAENKYHQTPDEELGDMDYERNHQNGMEMGRVKNKREKWYL